MNAAKRMNCLLVLLACVCIPVLASGCSASKPAVSLELVIENETNDSVETLVVEDNGSLDINWRVGRVPSRGIVKRKMVSQGETEENSLTLVDSTSGKRYPLVGYFEHSYSAKIRITITEEGGGRCYLKTLESSESFYDSGSEIGKPSKLQTEEG